MASGIQVAPVTGMSPARVAQELRLIIRDQLWAGIKKLGSPGSGGLNAHYSPQNSTAKRGTFNDVAMLREVAAQRLLDDLRELKEISKRRRPSETKKKIDEMLLEGGSYSTFMNHTNRLRSLGEWGFDRLMAVHEYAGNAAPSAPTNQVLIKQAERAYALVQALPTIENASTGREMTTIRAVTAILKVYWGIDVMNTMEQLPEVMPDLLAALKGEPEVVEEPVYEPVVEAPPIAQLPYTIWSGTNGVPHSIITQATDNKGYGHHDEPPGSVHGWNDGMCGFQTALASLRAVRAYYNDYTFYLKQNGLNVAIAAKGKLVEVVPYPTQQPAGAGALGF